jgi:ABC-type transport system involved in cytochrome c biogenesis permease component
MKLRTRAYIYLATVVFGILANFILHSYRMHLYNLDTDYEREPLQSIQMILLNGTLAVIIVGALLLAWWKLFRKN